MADRRRGAAPCEPVASARFDRLSEALRENLRKRKRQARERAARAKGGSETERAPPRA